VASLRAETDSRDQFLDGVLYDHKLDNVEDEVARARDHGYDEPDAPAHIGPILKIVGQRTFGVHHDRQAGDFNGIIYDGRMKSASGSSSEVQSS